MKYILLIGETYYPAGWRDFAGFFNTIQDAKKFAEPKVKEDYTWYQIIDKESGKLIYDYNTGI